MRRWHAFTLLEMLFTVAMIAILAAIAIPNFLDAQVRSKVARARGDMAALDAAIRAYSVQREAYPPNQPECLKWLKELRLRNPQGPEAPVANAAKSPRKMFDRDNEPHPLLAKTGWDLKCLTTPTAWIASSLPVDPFHSGKTDSQGCVSRIPMPFVYIDLYDVFHEDGHTTTTQGSHGFMLLSHGPDENLTLENPVYGPFIEYDPTNGLVSTGDLFVRDW